MISTHNQFEALEAVHPAELTLVEGGLFWGPSCPGYPGGDDPIFQPFGLPDLGRPIVLC